MGTEDAEPAMRRGLMLRASIPIHPASSYLDIAQLIPTRMWESWGILCQICAERVPSAKPTPDTSNLAGVVTQDVGIRIANGPATLGRTGLALGVLYQGIISLFLADGSWPAAPPFFTDFPHSLASFFHRIIRKHNDWGKGNWWRRRGQAVSSGGAGAVSLIPTPAV